MADYNHRRYHESLANLVGHSAMAWLVESPFLAAATGSHQAEIRAFRAGGARLRGPCSPRDGRDPSPLGEGLLRTKPPAHGRSYAEADSNLTAPTPSPLYAAATPKMDVSN